MAADLVANLPPFLDMPAHKVPRQALSRAFDRTFALWEPRLECLAAAAVAGPAARFRGDVAAPFAHRAMAGFCGIAPDPALTGMSAAFFRLFAPITDPDDFARTNAGIAGFRDLTLAATARQRADPGEDLISSLLALSEDLAGLDDRMIADLAILVYADGIENVEAACLSVWIRLAAKGPPPDPDTLDEALRLDTPAQILPRVARRDLDLHGTPVRAGAPVWLALGRRTATRRCSPTPTALSPAGRRRRRRSPSAGAGTAASGRRWPGR